MDFLKRARLARMERGELSEEQEAERVVLGLSIAEYAMAHRLGMTPLVYANMQQAGDVAEFLELRKAGKL